MRDLEFVKRVVLQAGWTIALVGLCSSPTLAQYGNQRYDHNYPRVRVDTSGSGSFDSRNAGSAAITRGWVDTSSGRPSVTLSGKDNFRITFYGNINRVDSQRVVMEITDSDRGHASGRAEFRLNGENNEVESIAVNGNVRGGNFNGSFSRDGGSDNSGGGYGSGNNGGYGNNGGGYGGGYGNGGFGNANYPRIRVDTSGHGSFSSRNAGSATITRGWVDTSSGRPSVILSGNNNFRITFYGNITRSEPQHVVMDIMDSDRGRASGRAEFRLNGDNNEVESITVNGNVQGGSFNGNFSR